MSGAHTKPGERGPPRFLVNLVTMLKLEDPAVLKWDAGHLILNNPKRLVDEVLAKYFRHNRYTSFQRQLHYFGFHKTDGKGRYVRSVYVNEQLLGRPVDAITSVTRKCVLKPTTSDEDNHSDASDSTRSCSSAEQPVIAHPRRRQSAARPQKRRRATPLPELEAEYSSTQSTDSTGSESPFASDGGVDGFTYYQPISAPQPETPYHTLTQQAGPDSLAYTHSPTPEEEQEEYMYQDQDTSALAVAVGGATGVEHNKRARQNFVGDFFDGIFDFTPGMDLAGMPAHGGQQPEMAVIDSHFWDEADLSFEMDLYSTGTA